MQMSWEGSEPVVRDVQLLQQVAAGQALCGVDKGGKWDDKMGHAGKAKNRGDKPWQLYTGKELS